MTTTYPRKMRCWFCAETFRSTPAEMRQAGLFGLNLPTGEYVHVYMHRSCAVTLRCCGIKNSPSLVPDKLPSEIR